MARTQAVGIAVLGAWVGWTLFMWFAATRSFRTVDRVLRKPNAEFEQAVQPLTPEQTRSVLRY
ncbi:MAG: hypothetical protein DMG27_19730, partial [Acidobacteria bacterium]